MTPEDELSFSLEDWFAYQDGTEISVDCGPVSVERAKQAVVNVLEARGYKNPEEDKDYFCSGVGHNSYYDRKQMGISFREDIGWPIVSFEIK